MSVQLHYSLHANMLEWPFYSLTRSVHHDVRATSQYPETFLLGLPNYI